MLPKYSIKYSTRDTRHTRTERFCTDDPVACEEFVEQLLESEGKLRTIKHDGLDLPPTDFDRIVKTAAAMMASKRICASLGIKPEEEHYRFGFTA